MTWKRAQLSAMILLLVCFTPLTAQHAPTDSILSVLSAAQRGNWYVRVTSPETALTGRLLTHDGETRIGKTLIDPTQVIRIERRHRRGGGKIPGAVVGGLLVGVLAYALAGFDDNPNDSGAFVGGAIVGAIPGGMIGALISPGAEEWHPVYTR